MRAATAASTMLVAVIYLVAQLVGAGVLIKVLTGLDFIPAVVLTGLAMLAYVVFGGMLATTWVQIIKAVLLLVAGAALCIGVLAKTGFDLGVLFTTAAANSPDPEAYLAPGGSGRSFIDTVSVALAFAIGTAALPHILIRFFTVPDAKQARRSAGRATGLIGAFFVMTAVIGFGARALLPPEAATAVGKSGNLAAPLFAEFLGGGPGTFGGDLFIAFISAVAFATILAVVAGLVLSASGAVAHDLWANVVRRGQVGNETMVARLAAGGIGIVAILLTLLMGPNFNVAFLVGLALSVAAGANFPALLLTLTWRRFHDHRGDRRNHRGPRHLGGVHRAQPVGLARRRGGGALPHRVPDVGRDPHGLPGVLGRERGVYRGAPSALVRRAPGQVADRPWLRAGPGEALATPGRTWWLRGDRARIPMT